MFDNMIAMREKQEEDEPRRRRRPSAGPRRSVDGSPGLSLRVPVVEHNKNSSVDLSAIDETSSVGSSEAPEEDGDENWGAVIKELSSLSKNIKALASTWQAKQATSAAALSGIERSYLEHAIDYSDTRPTVEVSIEILDVTSVVMHKQTFEAVFKVILDWEEPDFIEGIHYCQDMRSGGFVLSNCLLQDQNSFNPKIEIANGVDVIIVGQENEEDRTEPKIHRLVGRNKSGLSVWLTKEYVFEGTLKGHNIEAKWFPFDLHRLPIEVRSVPMPGVTTLGKPRKVRLTDPVLRRAEVWEKRQARQTGRKEAAVLRIDDFSQVPEEINAHNWKMVHTKSGFSEDEELPLKTVLGELQVCAYGGTTSSFDGYMLEIVLVRDWQAHAFDFTLQILLVLVALISVWVPLTQDTVTNRLQISLTVILAIVFLAVDKPAAIRHVPYNTAHDNFEHFMVVISALIAVENVAAYLVCHGWPQNRDGLSDGELYNSTLGDVNLCDASHLKASNFDTICFGIIVGLMILRFLFMLLLATAYQLHQLVLVKDNLNSIHSSYYATLHSEHGLRGATTKEVGVHQPAGRRNSFTEGVMAFAKAAKAASSFSKFRVKKVNRLYISNVVRGKVVFESRCSELDLAKCLARHGMVPLKVFPSLWVKASHVPSLSSIAAACKRRCKRRIYPRDSKWAQSRKGLGLLDVTPPATPKSMTSAGQGAKSSWKDRFLGARHIVLAPNEPAFIIDIGTGEVGFYQYQWRQRQGSPEGAKPMLFVDASSKLQLDDHSTFSDQYVLASTGAERFAEEIVRRFLFSGSEWASHFSVSQVVELGATAVIRGVGGLGRKQKVKILVGTTGQNRSDLIRSHTLSQAFENWVQLVETRVKEQLRDMVSLELLFFVPTEADEASYELWATEWLVRNGDLNVVDIPPGNHGVPFAGLELSQTLTRLGRRNNSLSATRFPLSEFLREFQDLVDGDVSHEFLAEKFRKVAQRKGNDDGMLEMSAVTELFRTTPPLMRSLIKSRLFNGTISAGGGSCQITVKSEMANRGNAPLGQARVDDKERVAQELRHVELYSVRLGNKSPLSGDDPLWTRGEPVSAELVRKWRERIQQEMESMCLPPKLQGNLRGVYIGISAVYYAAEKAECAEKLLPKAVFLKHLEEKLTELLRAQYEVMSPLSADSKGAGADLKGLSNLILVHEVVGQVLADTAWIVCKREWRASPANLFATLSDLNLSYADPDHLEALPEYKATWSLGYFLSQSR